jgi:aspartate/methionine/tyrosine aminotransferase
MEINRLKLPNYLFQDEIMAQHILCRSDAESLSMRELLTIASQEDLDLWNNLELGHTSNLGMPMLRQLIAQHMYTNLTPKHLLCFSGLECAIFASLSALCEKNDHIIILTPCYQTLIEVPKYKGCNITTVPLREENNWCIDIDAIQAEIKPNTKWLIINFPHNPSGQVITPEELKDLVSLLDKHGIWLFSDESARLLGSPIDGWADPAVALYPKALSVNSMSKSFGLSGLKIGWVACQDHSIINKIIEVKNYTSLGNSAPSEILSIIAIKNKEELLARNNKILADNLVVLDLFFTKNQKLFSWVWPQGGCVGWVNYKGKERIDTFCKKLLQNTGVLLMPASVYDINDNYFRIGFGHKDMVTAIGKLQQYLEA